MAEGNTPTAMVAVMVVAKVHLPADTEVRPIPGFEGRYFISRDGRVWSTRSQRWLVAHADTPYGHQRILLLELTGHRTKKWIHRAVLEAWIGPCPPDMLCRHLNSDATDNRLENLAWGTPAENSQDRDQWGERNSSAKLTLAQVREIKPLKGVEIARTVAARHGVKVNTIYSIWRGDSWPWV